MKWELSLSPSPAWERLVVDDNAAARSYERQLRQARYSMRKAAEAVESGLKDISRSFSDGLGRHSPVKLTPRHHSMTSPVKNAVGLIPPISSIDKRTVELLEEKVENIYSLRMRVYEMRATSKQSAHKWTALIDELEEIEARALTILVLPSSSIEDSDEHNRQLQLVLDRLEQLAVRCFEAAERLSAAYQDDTSSKNHQPVQRKPSAIATRTPVAAKPFPTIEEARQRVEQATNFLCPLLSDYTLRDSTLRVKRIISCACGQITGQDVNHCLDRLRYILSFLEDKPIQCTGLGNRGAPNSTHISLRELIPGDLGFAYAWRCLFSATLSQAENQFFYCSQSAVTYAYMLLGVLALHPDRVPEFLARVFLACPLLGLFVDKDARMTAKSMQDSGDQLARWRGIARLFAALCIGHPPKFLKTRKRPPHFTPALLWQMIAGMLKQEFVPCATAEVLHGLLEVGGTTLFKLYGRHFEKLLGNIVNTIQSSAELRQSSPEIALESTIEVAQRKKEFTHKLSQIV